MSFNLRPAPFDEQTLAQAKAYLRTRTDSQVRELALAAARLDAVHCGFMEGRNSETEVMRHLKRCLDLLSVFEEPTFRSLAEEIRRQGFQLDRASDPSSQWRWAERLLYLFPASLESEVVRRVAVRAPEAGDTDPAEKMARGRIGIMGKTDEGESGPDPWSDDSPSDDSGVGNLWTTAEGLPRIADSREEFPSSDEESASLPGVRRSSLKPALSGEPVGTSESEESKESKDETEVTRDSLEELGFTVPGPDGAPGARAEDDEFALPDIDLPETSAPSLSEQDDEKPAEDFSLSGPVEGEPQFGAPALSGVDPLEELLGPPESPPASLEPLDELSGPAGPAPSGPAGPAPSEPAAEAEEPMGFASLEPDEELPADPVAGPPEILSTPEPSLEDLEPLTKPPEEAKDPDRPGLGTPIEAPADPDRTGLGAPLQDLDSGDLKEAAVEPSGEEPLIEFGQAIPVFRIFDQDKALEFYCDFLGFQIEWEHRADEFSPIYLAVHREGLTIHLTEHHGDCCPGSSVFVWMAAVDLFHQELVDKDYVHFDSTVESSSNARFFEVIDPFGNRLRFSQPL